MRLVYLAGPKHHVPLSLELLKVCYRVYERVVRSDYGRFGTRTYVPYLRVSGRGSSEMVALIISKNCNDWLRRWIPGRSRCKKDSAPRSTSSHEACGACGVSEKRKGYTTSIRGSVRADLLLICTRIDVDIRVIESSLELGHSFYHRRERDFCRPTRMFVVCRSLIRHAFIGI